MSKISDELREHGNGYFEQRNGDCEWLYDIADRIDNEMVELPKGVDEKPIKPRQTAYDLSGSGCKVDNLILYFDGSWLARITPEGSSKSCEIIPESLTHTSPDSFESIADEMDKFVDDTPGIDTFYASTASRLRDFADRIRKLAKEQDHE